MYFHTDNQQVIWALAEMLADAYEAGRRVRFDVTDTGKLRVKVGEGMWSLINPTHDPYRDGEN